MLLFSTAAQRNDDAFAQWRSAICEQFVPLRPEPMTAITDLFGELRTWPVGPLTLTEISITAQRIHRGNSEIARSNREAFFLTAQLAGIGGFQCADGALRTRPGDLYFLDARRAFECHSEAFTRQLALTIPRAVCGTSLPGFDRAHGLAMTAGNPVGDLLHNYLRCIADADESLADAERDDIADHIIALINHVIARSEKHAPAPREALREALFTKACRLIERNLSEVEFDPAALARLLGVSLRLLQSVFTERETSPMRFIVERRTARAMKLLRSPALAGRTISQIAFDCGFRDLSHFGRVFAATTGHSPRDWRRGAG
jgi:AraC family transcriptional regulator, positive regulator of tynA and feaB